MVMTYLVGLGGGTGSGKGTIAGLIDKYLDRWGLSSQVMSTDDFYRDFSSKSADQRSEMCFDRDDNFDHPGSIDFPSLIRCVRNLQASKSFEYPKYDFSRHHHSDEMLQVPSGLDVAVIEGIYALYNGQEVGNELKDSFDYRVFVLTLPQLAQNRRILRDLRERGREPEHIVDQFAATVIPMQVQYVEPTRMNAHDVVDWGIETTKSQDNYKRRLMTIARQKALVIYESIKGPLLPELSLDEVSINGL